MSSRFMHSAYHKAGQPDVLYADRLAEQAHNGQDDGTGVDYIHHPRRVADNLWRLYNDTIIARPSDAQIMIALLHDVLEDTEITAQDLYNKGFSQHVVEGVQILTKSADSGSYDQRIQTIIGSGHGDAMWVKLCDLMDNLHPQRRVTLHAHDPRGAELLYDKYAPALEKLSTALGVASQDVWRCIRRAQKDQPVHRPG